VGLDPSPPPLHICVFICNHVCNGAYIYIRGEFVFISIYRHVVTCVFIYTHNTYTPTHTHTHTYTHIHHKPSLVACIPIRRGEFVRLYLQIHRYMCVYITYTQYAYTYIFRYIDTCVFILYMFAFAIVYVVAYRECLLHEYRVYTRLFSPRPYV